jgi:hypothetical protein
MNSDNSGKMIMNRTIWILIIMLLSSSVGLPSRVNAVSPSPIPEEREEMAAKGVKVKGAIVCLFQSGTADVKKAISIGDVLVVYREGHNYKLKEVGKIKVLSYSGEDYLKGEVVEGELQAGDIAKKEDVAGLVISSSDKCK